MRICVSIFLLTILIFQGCDLFSTRTPEEPEGGSDFVWRFPTNPDVVVENLEVAVGRRSSDDYMRSFITPEPGGLRFRFIADPDAQANNPVLFNEWDLNSERNHVQSLFAPSSLPLDSLIQLVITPTHSTPALGDSAELSAGYDFVIGHTLANAPRSMRGQLEFGMRRGNDGGWYIHRWRDMRIADHHCWSDLKAAL